MELLDIVDENGIPTGRSEERALVHRSGLLHRTAHLWLFRRRASGVQLLLQKRSDNKDSYPGCWDISSAGHIPAGQDWIPSALRELHEELGISARPEELIFCGVRHFSVDGNFHGEPFYDRQVSRVYAMERDLPEAAFALQPTEVQAVMWMDYEECVRSVNERRFPTCIFSEELRMLKSAF